MSAPDDPKRYARVTVNNVAALAAEGASVRVEIGNGTAPTSFALLAVLTPKFLASGRTSIRLPRMHAGSQHATRMRAEKQGMRPGPYTMPVPIVLEPLSAPSALAAVSRAGDSTIADVTWSPGEAKEVAEVCIRVKGRQSWRRRYAVAGSTGMALDALKPGTTYELEVRHKELPPYKGTSPAVSLTFTTGTDVHVLPVPTSPAGFVTRRGVYGMEVTAAEVPSQIAFQIAIEDAPDAGTFGPYQEPSNGLRSAVVPPGRTRFEGLAPADGKVRRIRACTVRYGATASDWCASVDVLPYSVAPDGTPTTAAMRRKGKPPHAPKP